MSTENDQPQPVAQEPISAQGGGQTCNPDEESSSLPKSDPLAVAPSVTETAKEIVILVLSSDSKRVAPRVASILTRDRAALVGEVKRLTEERDQYIAHATPLIAKLDMIMNECTCPPDEPFHLPNCPMHPLLRMPGEAAKATEALSDFDSDCGETSLLDRAKKAAQIVRLFEIGVREICCVLGFDPSDGEEPIHDVLEAAKVKADELQAELAQLRQDKERLEWVMEFITQNGGDGIAKLIWSQVDPEEIMEDRIDLTFDRATIDRAMQPSETAT